MEFASNAIAFLPSLDSLSYCQSSWISGTRVLSESGSKLIEIDAQYSKTVLSSRHRDAPFVQRVNTTAIRFMEKNKKEKRTQTIDRIACRLPGAQLRQCKQGLFQFSSRPGQPKLSHFGTFGVSYTLATDKHR